MLEVILGDSYTCSFQWYKSHHYTEAASDQSVTLIQLPVPSLQVFQKLPWILSALHYVDRIKTQPFTETTDPHLHKSALIKTLNMIFGSENTCRLIFIPEQWGPVMWLKAAWRHLCMVPFPTHCFCRQKGLNTESGSSLQYSQQEKKTAQSFEGSLKTIM